MTSWQTLGGLDCYVPPFVKISRTSECGASKAYAVSNEASGKYFAANASTVTFLEAVNGSRTLAQAAVAAGLSLEQAEPLVTQMMKHGVLVERGKTHAPPAKKRPIEAHAIMMRFDVVDASAVTRRFLRVGRFAYSRTGLTLWLLLLIGATFAMIGAGDQVLLALQKIPDVTVQSVILLALVMIATKVFHEMGHALAYAVMCEREDLSPGPIRMGISIFALTPFPFTDVTGAWRLRSRFRRAAIGAGGLYFELGFVAALVLFWTNTAAGPLQEAVFQAAIISVGFSVLFNMNPLIKLDGYYVLIDLLGLTNFASRSAMAGRATFARALGASLPRPARFDLAYSVMSYLYRWSIFAGIFWVAYQFDRRLATALLGVILIMLVIRPVVTSLKYARQMGAKPLNVVFAAGTCVSIALACAIPFPDRLLLSGQIVTYSSEFVRVLDAARVGEQGRLRPPALTSVTLEQQLADLALQRQVMMNTLNSAGISPAETARLKSDISQQEKLIETMRARIDALSLELPNGGIWSPVGAEHVQGAWVNVNFDEPLGVISQPAPTSLRLWIDQFHLEQGILGEEGQTVRVRLEQNPHCEFKAELQKTESTPIYDNNAIRVLALPVGDMPACASSAQSGVGVVARLRTADKSIIERGRLLVSRIMQNRRPTSQEL